MPVNTFVNELHYH